MRGSLRSLRSISPAISITDIPVCVIDYPPAFFRVSYIAVITQNIKRGIWVIVLCPCALTIPDICLSGGIDIS